MSVVRRRRDGCGAWHVHDPAQNLEGVVWASDEPEWPCRGQDHALRRRDAGGLLAALRTERGKVKVAVAVQALAEKKEGHERVS